MPHCQPYLRGRTHSYHATSGRTSSSPTIRIRSARICAAAILSICPLNMRGINSLAGWLAAYIVAATTRRYLAWHTPHPQRITARDSSCSDGTLIALLRCTTLDALYRWLSRIMVVYNNLPGSWTYYLVDISAAWRTHDASYRSVALSFTYGSARNTW